MHPFILLITFAAGVGLVFGARKIRKIRDDQFFRYTVATVLLSNSFVAYAFYASGGLMVLPFQLCDLALFAVVYSLVKRNRFIVELAFIWGLGASLQAVLTPDIHDPFPPFGALSFYIGHCGVVLSAIYLSVRGYVKMTPISVWRVWGWTNVYLMFVGVLNWQLGTNFGYLARKPSHSSIIDFLGPWPYYILSMELIALGAFFLCYFFNQMIGSKETES